MQDDKAIAEINYSGLKFKWICITMCVGFAALGWGIGPIASCATTNCAKSAEQAHKERLTMIESTGSPTGLSSCNPTQDQFLKMKYGKESETEPASTQPMSKSEAVGPQSNGTLILLIIIGAVFVICIIFGP